MSYLKYSIQHKDMIVKQKSVINSIINTLNNKYKAMQYKFDTMYNKSGPHSSIKFITHLQQQRKEYEKQFLKNEQEREIQEIQNGSQAIKVQSEQTQPESDSTLNDLLQQYKENQHSEDQSLKYVPQIIKYELILIGVSLVIILFMLMR